MKKLIAITLFIFPFLVFAQPQRVMLWFPSTGCELVEQQLGWINGQNVPLETVQAVLKNMSLSSGWSIAPQSAIDQVLSLTTILVPKLTYHCKNSLYPPELITFYFTYLEDDILVQTPDITLYSVIIPPY